MTAGPTEVRENVLKARSMPFTNPDLDLDFYDYYKETLIYNQTFTVRDYFWPIHQNDLVVNPKLVQNPGW